MQSSFEKNKWKLSLLLLALAGLMLGYLFHSPEPVYTDRGMVRIKTTERAASPELRRHLLFLKCNSGYYWKVYTSEDIYSRYKPGDSLTFHCPKKYVRY